VEGLVLLFLFLGFSLAVSVKIGRAVLDLDEVFVALELALFLELDFLVPLVDPRTHLIEETLVLVLLRPLLGGIRLRSLLYNGEEHAHQHGLYFI